MKTTPASWLLVTVSNDATTHHAVDSLVQEVSHQATNHVAGRFVVGVEHTDNLGVDEFKRRVQRARLAASGARGTVHDGQAAVQLRQYRAFLQYRHSSIVDNYQLQTLRGIVQSKEGSHELVDHQDFVLAPHKYRDGRHVVAQTHVRA